jgi:hypothetical protein
MKRLTTLSVLVTLSTLPLAAAEGGSGDMATAVDCAGAYLQLDLAGREVAARGQIWEHPSMTDLRPSPTGRFDGCLVAAVAADRDRGRLYAAVARDSYLNSRGGRRYRLVALSLPSLERLASVDLGAELDGPPALLLSVDRHRLLVGYSMGVGSGARAAWRNVIASFALPGLTPLAATEKLRPIAEDDPDPLYVTFQPGSYWDGNGRIVDGTKILDPEGRVLERIIPYRLIDDGTRAAFRHLEAAGAAGRMYLPIAFADTAGERALFVVGSDRGRDRAPGSGLWLYDLESGVTLARISTSVPVAAFDPTRRATPTAHLTPNGEGIVVEHFERRPHAASAPEEVRFKTGRLDLYEAASGRLERTFELQPAPGSRARLAGFSPDSRIALVGARERIYAVDLTAETSPWAAATGGQIDGFWLQGLVFSPAPR